MARKDKKSRGAEEVKADNGHQRWPRRPLKGRLLPFTRRMHYNRLSASSFLPATLQ